MTSGNIIRKENQYPFSTLSHRILDHPKQTQHDIQKIHALQKPLDGFELAVSLTLVSWAMTLKGGERTESRPVRIMAAFRAVFGSSKESAETAEAGTLELGNLRYWLVALPVPKVSTGLSLQVSEFMSEAQKDKRKEGEMVGENQTPPCMAGEDRGACSCGRR